MEYVILFRNPRSMKVGGIMTGDEEDSLEVFASEDDAAKFANGHILLKAWPYQIVELDVL
jgi:hypothetical protein